jgi:hypothetical protein
MFLCLFLGFGFGVACGKQRHPCPVIRQVYNVLSVLAAYMIGDWYSYEETNRGPGD